MDTLSSSLPQDLVQSRLCKRLSIESSNREVSLCNVTLKRAPEFRFRELSLRKRSGIRAQEPRSLEGEKHGKLDGDHRFQLLVQEIKDYGICMLDPEGRILIWNEGAERLMGYTSAEIIGRMHSILFTMMDRKEGKPETLLRRAREYGRAQDEDMRIRKDGTNVWIHALTSALRDEHGRFRGFAQIMRDATGDKDRETALRAARNELENRVRERTAELVHLNRKLLSEVQERQRAEDQLRALAARLHKSQEAERIHLAKEIHDALGQLCTALKMDLDFISRKVPRNSRRVREKSQSAIELVDDLIRSLRRLSAELHPSILHALGLSAAMEWHGEQFQRRTGIKCRLQIPEKVEGLDIERSTAVFRIFQEALTNIARHSRATQLETTLAIHKGSLSLLIRDNGVGFNIVTAGRGDSLGLLGMKERARLLGGELTVVSSPGNGTTITLRVPDVSSG